MRHEMPGAGRAQGRGDDFRARCEGLTEGPVFAGRWHGPRQCRCLPGRLVLLVALSGVLVPHAAAGASATAVAAGEYHTCAVTSGGAVQCWGANGYGQLGDGTTVQRLSPMTVSGLGSGVMAVAAGASHTCALTSGGAVWCWGQNTYGQLGDGTTTHRLTPVTVSGLGSGVVDLAAGDAHTCAVTSGGAARCWGANSFGQLGDGTTTNRSTPVAVSGLGSGVAAVAGGDSHTCAVTSGGAVQCWGFNGYGELGDGTTTQRLTPVTVSGLTSGVVAVAAGYYHTCALTSGGGLQCWGQNTYGQLGDGTTTQRLTPVTVSELGSGVATVAAGAWHTCAVTSGGAVQCWGLNGDGELGDATTANRSTPVPVIGLGSGVESVAPSGFYHSCAVTSGGAVQCWGRNDHGQLGDGTTTNRSTPVAVSGMGSGVVTVAAGESHTCALTSGGAVRCWGRNDYGQLGDGTTTDRHTPAQVTGLANGVTAIAAGWSHTCAVTTGGGVLCWGRNSSGQLGDGTTTTRLTPVPVTGLVGEGSGLADLAAGSSHTCALTSGGPVCWGANSYGQLGDGTTTNRSTPVPVSGSWAPGIYILAAGATHTCGMGPFSTVLCWGNNASGQLGNGTTTSHSTPEPLAPCCSGGTSVGTGHYHSCSLTGTGVQCWGNNQFGQLGDGTTTDRWIPVYIGTHSAGLFGLVGGAAHTCMLTFDNRVKCWGNNSYGQLGDGTTTQRLTPVSVIGLPSGSTALAAGSSHTCAVTGGGGVQCWGANSYGQLGDGTTTNRSTPVPVNGFASAAPTVTGISPPTGSTLGGTAVTIAGTGFASGATVTLGGGAATSVTVVSATSITAVTPAHAAGFVDVVVTNPDAQTGTLAQAFMYVVPVPDADADGLPNSWETGFGLNPNSATGDDGASGDPDHDGRTNLQEYQAGTHPRGFYTRYFAEGAIIPGFFQVDIALLNVDPAVNGHVWLRYQREGATEVGQAVAVPPLGRRTVRVNDNPVMGTPSYTAFSTVIESDVPVVADRTMIWDDRGYGSHAETSIASPAGTWYLAEGATHSGFDLYYLIQNPNPSAVTVQVTYLRPSPLAPVVKQYAVGALSRKTIYVNGEGPELAATDVSAKIESLNPALPVIVERAMYLTDGWGHMFGAGHESAGVTAASTHWFLAEGATVSAFGSTGSFFDMYVLIANPNAAASTVTMTYLLPDGTTVTKSLAVAGNSRQTVYVNAVDAKLADTPVSTVVTSTQPVIVERAMWWPGPTWATWYEAHNSPGTTETGTLWALAEGESGGSRAVETYILIANTSSYAGQVKVTLLFEEGTPATAEQTFTVLANSRRTIYPPLDFASALPAATHRRYGALLESVGTTPAQIVVERAMYANDSAGVVWAAGTNAVGTEVAGGSGRVRVLYVMPADRALRSDYYGAVESAMASVQSWYRQQLGGETFSLFRSQPEICQLPQPAAYYASDSWAKVMSDVQSCAPVSSGSPVYSWVLYVDVVHACNAPGRLGAATLGLTMMPRQDMDGLIGAPYFDDCGQQWFQPVNRYVGGAAHELGHTFGLSHPPGCDAGLPSCDSTALMWQGYSIYPNTYLRSDDKQILFASPFIW